MSLKDKVAREGGEREKVKEKLDRLGWDFVENIVSKEDCERQKAQYE
jgi:hypothetical protein